MLIPLRALSLVLIAGWHFAAAGVDVSHWCRMSERPVSCACPHASPDHEQDGQAAASSAHCCELRFTVASTPLATADSLRSLSVQVAAPPVAVLPVVTPVDAGTVA